MRPDREKLFQLLRDRHGVREAALRRLEKDLEPVFLMADDPRWPEGTDCGLASPGAPRRPSERTQPLPSDIEPALVYARIYDGAADRDSLEAIVERFHERICDAIGYGRVVEIGSALGDALLDPLFRAIGARGIDAYLNLQFLALYRAAAAVAGFESDAAQLGLYLRRFTGVTEDCQEVEEDHILDEAPDIQQAG